MYFYQIYTGMNLEAMDSMEHSHTPYLVILYKYLQQWKKDNNSNWPKSYAEKRQIRDMMRTGIRTNDDGVREDEENFEEAIKNCNSAFTPTQVPSEVQELLGKSTEIVQLDQLPPRSAKFWCLVKALKEFVDAKGVMPIRGTLPDMFSDSKRYIELQNIYRDLAARDIQTMIDLTNKCVQNAQLPATLVSPEDVKTFCRNSYFLRAIAGCTLQDEMTPKNTVLNETIESSMENGGDLYMVVRVLNRFLNSGRYPFTGHTGQNDGEATTEDSNDMQRLRTLSEQLIQEMGVQVAVPSDHFQELLRCKLDDVHVVASVLGGVCAQEVIKLITKQFVPVDNVLFFNAMTQTTSTLKV